MCQKMLFFVLQKEFPLESIFKKLGRSLFGGEGLLCKNWKEMEWHLFMQEVH